MKPTTTPPASPGASTSTSWSASIASSEAISISRPSCIARSITASDTASMHFDAVSLAVIDRAMHEGREIEIASELAIDADQDVEVEAPGDAGGVVVGFIQHAVVLFEIDANHHLRVVSQDLAGAAQ